LKKKTETNQKEAQKCPKSEEKPHLLPENALKALSYF
jgi:hypothetical protein